MHSVRYYYYYSTSVRYYYYYSSTWKIDYFTNVNMPVLSRANEMKVLSIFFNVLQHSVPTDARLYIFSLINTTLDLKKKHVLMR